MWSIEQSLQRLVTNALDIVLIHDANRRWQDDLVEQRCEEAMTGAKDGATFFYVEAEPAIKERTRRIEAVCARHGVALAAAAIQFPLHHPAVASVVTGMRSEAEATANLAHCRAAIPADFWNELKDEGLIDRSAPAG